MSVLISLGDNWANAISASPNGTQFDLAPGDHGNQGFIPKPGIGLNAPEVWPPVVKVNGGGVTQYFVNGGTAAQPAGVALRYIEYMNYAPPSQQGAVRAGDGGFNNAPDWICDHLWGHDNVSSPGVNNFGIGLRVGHRMRVLGGRYNNNGKLGMGGVGDNILIEGAEIDHNNPSLTQIGFESGGTKFVKTNGLVVRRVFAHHNGGGGIWCDIANDNSLFEFCRAEDNWQNGLAHEISYSAIVRYCVCRRNGWNLTPGPAGSAGISVHHSGGSGFLVHNNLLAGNGVGVGLTQSQRGQPLEADGHLGPYLTQNVSIFDNTIIMRPDSFGAIYAVDDSGTTMGPANAIFTSRNNRAFHNKFFLNAEPKPFAWLGAVRTKAEWQGYGHDLTSEFYDLLARFEAGDPYV